MTAHPVVIFYDWMNQANAEVTCWHLADIPMRSADIRFRGKADIGRTGVLRLKGNWSRWNRDRDRRRKLHARKC
jgi:hypothetical protein